MLPTIFCFQKKKKTQSKDLLFSDRQSLTLIEKKKKSTAPIASAKHGVWVVRQVCPSIFF